jgi:hypothetical protein
MREMYNIISSLSILLIAIAFFIIFKDYKYNIGYLIMSILIIVAAYILMTGSVALPLTSNTIASNTLPVSNVIYQSNSTSTYVYIYNSSQYNFYIGNSSNSLIEVSDCTGSATCESMFYVPANYYYKLINTGGKIYTIYQNLSINQSD